MGRTARGSSTGGSSGGAGASPAGSTPTGGAGAASARCVTTPEKSVVDTKSFLSQWNTPDKGCNEPLSPPLDCNRPGCSEALEKFIPPGTGRTGVTFGICASGSCAGGGSILAFPSKCGACYGTITEGTVCLSLKTGDKQYTNQHLRNCLLDKIPRTENAAYASKAAAKDIGKECTACVQADAIVTEGDILLSSATLGTRIHYACACKKRKDYLRVVYDIRDKRHASFLNKEVTSAAKKTKVEEPVGFALLAPDSDDEL